MLKKFLLLIALIACASISLYATDAASLANVRYLKGSKSLSFTIRHYGTPGDAWVGIVPAGTPHNENAADRVDLAYKYLRDLPSGGTYTIQKDLPDGDYELHVYANDNGGNYLCGQRFKVGEPKISLTETGPKPKSGSSSTQSGSSSTKSSGKHVGVDIGPIPNTTKTRDNNTAAGGVTLLKAVWDKSRQAVVVRVRYGNVASDAWIGIVPINTPKNEKAADRVDITYKYLKNLKNGQDDILKPGNLKPGRYEVHIYANDNGGDYLGGKIIYVN